MLKRIDYYRHRDIERNPEPPRLEFGYGITAHGFGLEWVRTSFQAAVAAIEDFCLAAVVDRGRDGSWPHGVSVMAVIRHKDLAWVCRARTYYWSCRCRRCRKDPGVHSGCWGRQK